jgi:hypothetical protein
MIASSVAIVLRSRHNPDASAVNPILHGEGNPHQRSKKRLYSLINTTGQAKLIEKEHEFPNPVDPQFPWKFDVYAELYNGRKIAIEVDGTVGHTSKRSHEKRRAKTSYLKLHGIELFSFPTKWIISRKPVSDMLFLQELGLVAE